MTSNAIRLGAVGLGRGFALSARAFIEHPNVELVAAATRSSEAREAFENNFGGKCYASLDELVADSAVEMVYVATPHQLHKEHVCVCLEAGKHVVVEKPLSISLQDASIMINLARNKGLKLLVGPSHSYDPPIALAAELIASGRLGKARMLHGLMATDFIYRPRRPEELRTEDGGGIIFSQAIHHVDVAMRILGCAPLSVHATTGAWDTNRPTEGAYCAMLKFPDNVVASLTYSGYGYFNSNIMMNNTTELGVKETGDSSGRAKQALTSIADETVEKTSRAFSGISNLPEPSSHEHYGHIVVFCEQGDISLTPNGVILYGDKGKQVMDAPFNGSRQAFAQALVDALRNDHHPVQSGEWGRDSLRACHAILQSAKTGTTIQLAEVHE